MIQRPGRVAQSVTCLATDASLTADPGVASSIVNFPIFDGDVPRSPYYGVYISQIIFFARVSPNVDHFNNRNLFLTAKLLKKVIDIIKFEKHFQNSTTDTQS